MRYLPGLPWSATETPAGKGKIVDNQGFSVAACSGSNYEESKQHAAYIVNAVNNHARLVEALEEVDSWDWESLRADPDHVDWRSALEDVKRAGEALAAAKGGE